MPYFNPETGIPDLPDDPGETAYTELRTKIPDKTSKRALERIMTAVIIYSKVTGNDIVPGYNGSISAPFMKAIINGTDPESPYYWGEPYPYDAVGSMFALAAYVYPERFWEPLTAKQKKNLLLYLQKQTYNKSHNNNHHFFHMTPVPLLEQNGMEGNRKHLTEMFQRLMDWYRGDGWFIDGSNQGFDYYNPWGFQLYNHILYKYDSIWRKQFGEIIKETTDEFLKTSIYLYGQDGGPVPWGRSLTYRFASNAAISWASINDLCTLSPGQARRIVSGNLKYFWDHGCFSDNGLLDIGFWGSNASVAEDYLVPGDPYWAMNGLACLLLPATDPFWSDVELPIPADDTGGKLTVPGARFTVRVSSVDGESRLFPVEQPFAFKRTQWQTGIKYDQHAYSSYLGFCITGEGGPDIGAGRSGYSYDGVKWHYRERAKAIQVESDHLVSSYFLVTENNNTQQPPKFPTGEMITHTLAGNDGEIHIFWHNNPEPIHLYLGGYGISIPHGEELQIKERNAGLLIHGGEYYSLLQPVKVPEGQVQSEVLNPEAGWNHTHLFGGKGAYTYWESDDGVPPGKPVIFYVNGTRGRIPEFADIKVKSLPGLLKIQFEGNWFDIELQAAL